MDKNNSFDVIAKPTEPFASLYVILAAIIILLLDYLTGKDIHFPILFIFPIGLAAWSERISLAYGLSFLMPLFRIGFYLLWHDSETYTIIVINCFIIMIALMIYAYFMGKTIRQNQELNKKVKTLEGILPICSFCKKIRNESGQYERLENYISNHTEALFSHSICPECLKEQYPDYSFDDSA